VTKQSVHLAGAIVLANSAQDILADAASELKDAGEEDGHQELTTLATGLSKAVQRLLERKDAICAASEASAECGRGVELFSKK
jgi:hypothetical protein